MNYVQMKKNWILLLAISGTLAFTSCGDDDAPDIENEEEVITAVTLTFTPDQGSPVIFSAIDPDGEGPQDMAPTAPIELDASTTYTLEIGMTGLDGENIGAEVEEEADEHQLFFGWTDGLFADPAGDGNIDNSQDDVNYLDQDGASLPLGLSTEWTTAASTTGGTFRIILKHQPDIKSATSTSTDGETDVDISWTVTVQ